MTSLSSVITCKWVKLSNQRTEIGRMIKNMIQSYAFYKRPALGPKTLIGCKGKNGKTFHENSNQKGTEVAILIPDKRF